jgi:hypothetical protein
MRQVLAVLCFAALFAADLFLAGPARAERVTFPPFDEAAQEPDFAAFRDELLAAVKARDIDAIVAAAADDIQLSYGGDAGTETFRSWLQGGGYDEVGNYWAKLERVLSEGGRFEGGMFVAPWSYWLEPLSDEDFYTTAVVAGENVRLRAGPSTADRVIRALSWEVVRQMPYDDSRPMMATDASGREWVLVQTLEGEEGWVALEFLRFPIEYRAGFELRDGDWRMIFFIAGD